MEINIVFIRMRLPKVPCFHTKDRYGDTKQKHPVFAKKYFQHRGCICFFGVRQPQKMAIGARIFNILENNPNFFSIVIYPFLIQTEPR